MTPFSVNPISMADAAHTDVRKIAHELAHHLIPDREENRFFRNSSRAALENSLQEALWQTPNDTGLSIDDLYDAMKAVQ